MAACAVLALAFVPGADAQAPATATTPVNSITLPGYVPPLIGSSALEGRILGTQTLHLAIALPIQNPASLDLVLNALYDPASSIYHQYLSPAQFAGQFAPTQAQYDAVSAYLQSKGLTVTGTHTGRLLLDAQGSAAIVEAAFGVHINRYLSPSGREFYAPDLNPAVDPSMAGLVSGIIGLDDATIGKAAVETAGPAGSSANTTGSFSNGGLTPNDIRTAYNLNPLPANGTGQSVALFEANGFNASDVSAYESQFGLPNVPIQVFALDGSSGQPFYDQNTDGQAEATLDIEMLTALAPNLSKIYVYEVPNQTADFAVAYARIADDGLAKQVSTSWFAAAEGQSNAPASLVSSENTAFQQMAAQGQTIFSSSGDRGAYSNGSSLSVLDPASQPGVCSVGGTALKTQGPGGPYVSETTWGNSTRDIGSGGGVSTIWPIPAWQAPRVVASTASNSAGNNINAFNYRNVPDVALNADPDNSPYTYYVRGGWSLIGGTSAAAPLWASFTALANELRAAGNAPPIGQINSLLYAFGTAQYQYETGLSSQAVADFHDIQDTSDNLYDVAVTGYDDATGWGSFNGASLLADLVHPPAYATTPLPQPFYRLYQSNSQTGTDTYYDTKMSMVYPLIGQGWSYVGVIGFGYNGQYDVPNSNGNLNANLIPLYKLVRQTPYQDNFFTTSQAEVSAAEASGYYSLDNGPNTNYTGIQCWVFPLPSGQYPAVPGAVPVYRGFDHYGHHVFTTIPSEAQGWTGGAGNYTNEGPQFYVLAR